MSSTIKLYEHNQKAYDALLDMLGERDRACVIKPTGTGKFVIIAKMVQDNPDKRFLLLGTNDYMFNDQMANLTEIAPGFTPENLQFMTYSAAMMAARRGEEISSYDVVVADEFHHCGAEEWGKGVTHILDANESAKVVGFSATPIRYSDGGRNMADEMFDGNVAYSMELEEAWLRGILPIPKYVTAFYEAPKELGRLAKSIDGIKDEMVMKRFQKKYENLRRSLTEAGGVREAIAKHLKKRDAKVIVFCPRVAKLREFMLLRREWFGAVNSEIHAYKTVSADPYGSEDFQAFKDDKSDALKVLYCVNQLNEAVHVKGVDAIVMVRPTKSPTVFYQQLGRVLSSGGNRTPLVFDLCNNFSSITATEGICSRMENTYREIKDINKDGEYEEGWYDTRISQSIIMNIQAEFDQLINAVVTSINSILQEAAEGAGDAGASTYLRDENGKPYQLFEKSIEEGDWTVSNIVINTTLRQNPALLTFRLPDHSEDNATMEKLKTAFQEKIYTLNPNVQTPVNFIDYYKNLVSQVANSGSVYREIQESQTVSSDALLNAREQIVGVSSDEELSNMIMYQNAYNASSRYINVISEMLEHILTSLG